MNSWYEVHAPDDVPLLCPALDMSSDQARAIMGLEPVEDVIAGLCGDLRWHEGYPPAPGEGVYRVLPGKFAAIDAGLLEDIEWPGETDLRFRAVHGPDGRRLLIPYAARVSGAYSPGILDSEWEGTGRQHIVRAKISSAFEGRCDAFTLEEAALPLLYVEKRISGLLREIRDRSGRRVLALLDALIAN